MNTFTFSRRAATGPLRAAAVAASPALAVAALATALFMACIDTRTASLETGAIAEDFTLVSQHDEPVHFAEVNAERWTVVVFYRGFW